jgi:hypothetical protein
MTYETVAAELFERLPKLKKKWEVDLLGDPTSMPYVVFGTVLIPVLEEALENGNLGVILPVCAFLEDAAEASRKDVKLKNLLKVEIGKWLGGVAHEERLTPWLGQQTRQVCGYVPGLATQRITLAEAQKQKSFFGLLIRALRYRHRSKNLV